MRKILTLMIAAVLVIAFAVTAGAADYEGLADDFAAIGMFTGTDQGYDLDREPTRAEVAVMLVRMLGAGAQAKDGYADGSLSHPFSDVPEWAAPSVAFLYTKGLTSGITDTAFGSDQLCSGQMYCTFMLRALGYSDAEGGDFTYVGALDFAQEKILVISGLVSESFTRDELVAVSHQTLRTPVKGSDQTLLEKLTAAGAIDKTAAAALERNIDVLMECNEILLQNIADNTALDCSIKFDLTASIRQKAMTSVFMYNFLADLKFIYADIASKADLSITMVDPVSNEQFVIHAWIKDGWLYLQEGEKCTKVQIDFEEILGTYENAKEQLNSEVSEVGETAIPSYIFSSVTKTETAEGTQYEFVISPKFISAVFRQAYGEAPLESSEYSIIINSARFSQVVVVKDEKVKKISFYMDVDLESSQYEHISGKVDYVINVNGMGKDVTIDYPDFSGFVEEAAEDPVSES